MVYVKSYTLTEEQQKKVDELVAHLKEKYKEFDHIIGERALTEEELVACGYFDED